MIKILVLDRVLSCQSYKILPSFQGSKCLLVFKDSFFVLRTISDVRYCKVSNYSFLLFFNSSFLLNIWIFVKVPYDRSLEGLKPLNVRSCLYSKCSLLIWIQAFVLFNVRSVRSFVIFSSCYDSKYSVLLTFQILILLTLPIVRSS